VALATILAAFIPSGRVEVAFTPLAQGARPVLVLSLKPGQRFTIFYIHSVDRAPIWEEHSVDAQGHIYIETEKFVMFGAGMGHWQGHGVLGLEGHYQVIRRIHMRVDGFVLRVGSPTVSHTVIWPGGCVNLSVLMPHWRLKVTARPVSVLTWVVHRLWAPYRLPLPGASDEQ